MNNGKKAKLHNTLLAAPFRLKPTLEKMSLKDRRFSHTAKKAIRKTRSTP
jgi:hypothetical protein